MPRPRPATLQALAWVLIYAGALVGVLALALAPDTAPWRAWLGGGGAALAALGAGLIYWRSRLPP